MSDILLADGRLPLRDFSVHHLQAGACACFLDYYSPSIDGALFLLGGESNVLRTQARDKLQRDESRET